MNIQLGNLGTITALAADKENAKEKLAELETKLQDLGYVYEDNCEKNTDTSRKTYHVYDMPRRIEFSVLDEKTVLLLKQYSEFFQTVAVGANKMV